MEETLNQHLNFGPVTNRSDKPRVGLFLFASPEKYSYRYMYERLMERSEGLSSSFPSSFELTVIEADDFTIYSAG